MELTVLPKHLIVLGGCYVGLEFCHMFRRFGARVTVVNRDPRLIAREDPDVSAEVEKILKDDGIDVLNSAQVTGLKKSGAGVRARLQADAGAREISGSHLLLALGRVPNSDRLNLSAAGVATDPTGFIKVNSKLETNVPDVYAIGDVKGGPAFTHISYDDFRILRENWLAGGGATTDGRPVPNCMYIDPQLATVGINETEAQKRGIDYRVAMLQIAMMGKLPYPVIKEAIFAHPTLAESLNNLFMTLDPR